MIKKLNIVSFDVPYPPNYGGVIDVFYKLKALHQLGVDIHFHTFEYGRGKQPELLEYCSKVFYYSRNSFIKSFFSTDPFIVKSRFNDTLIKNLNKTNHPILFEGLHTTIPMMLHRLQDQKTYVRAHNIEHKFYEGLAESESNVFKKNFFFQESKKLEHYEKVLIKSDGIFTISPFEQNYFKNNYGTKCTYIPAFHDHKINTTHQKTSRKILYHGNLLVSENVRAVLFLIDIYKDSSFQLTIASHSNNKEVEKEINKYPNIHFQQMHGQKELFQLFEEAHINLLPTFQKTGIKLKLLNTLYQGKFIIANDYMVEDTGLEKLCERANSKEEFLEKTNVLLEKKFSDKIIVKRLNTLKSFNPMIGAQKIIDVIFN